MKRLLVILLAGLVIALVAAVGYGVVITVDRNALNTKLESVQSVLTSTQAQLSSTKQTLTSTQSELGSTKQTLTSTQQTLALTKTELSHVNSTLASVQSELGAIKTKMDAIDAKLKLYEDTMGIKIFSGVQPLARGAGPIELVNNSAATNPTWQQLISFLRADPTDDRTWTEGIFVSGDFANMLHNNAEAAGIRAAVVGVFFEGKTIGHGLNAFKTTDRGLVYVDCTGASLGERLRQMLSYSSKPTSRDRIAYVVKGKEFGAISLGQNTPLDYASYEKLKADISSYDQKLEAYNRDVKAYNDAYNAEQRWRARLTPAERMRYATAWAAAELRKRIELRGISELGEPLTSRNVYGIGTPGWFVFMEASLKQQKTVLDSLRAQSEDLWDPMGIVERIEIYW